MVPGEFKEIFQVTRKNLRRWFFRWWIVFRTSDWLWAYWALNIFYLNDLFLHLFPLPGVMYYSFFYPRCLSAWQTLSIPNCTDYSCLLTLVLSSLIRSLLKIKSYHESHWAFVEKKTFAHMPWSLEYTEIFLIQPLSGPYVLLTLFCCVPSIHDNTTKSEVEDLNYGLWPGSPRDVYFLFEVVKPIYFEMKEIRN